MGIDLRRGGVIDQAETHKKVYSDLAKDRHDSASFLGSAFEHIPDKDQAWNDLITLVYDSDSSVTWEAAKFLSSVFPYVPNKLQAWQDLLWLLQLEDYDLANYAAKAIESAFLHIPDKSLGWQSLIELTQEERSYAPWNVAVVFCSGAIFPYVPDKDQAWKDLIWLIQNSRDHVVLWSAADAIRSAFPYVPDRLQAWQDLHNLTHDENSDVRQRAAGALGSAFSYVSDKDLAYQDLHRLTHDEDRDVRGNAANSLGSAFSQAPDKDRAWQDLHNLTLDEDSSVRMYAYHALGRVSVFKATEVKADDKITLRQELEVAVYYFEKSSKESDYSPARFCYPFYRTYYAITFQDAKDDEVQKYLDEAKIAVSGSESKNELLKAVENLAHALRESQHLKERSIQEIANELNAYRWYCDKAANHMSKAEDKAPVAVKLMRRCNPLLEYRIQTTIAEIQKSARKICESTHGSGMEYEALGAELQKAAKGLSTNDIAGVQNCSSMIVWQLRKFCHLLPPEDKERICNIVEEIGRESDYPEKLHKILTAILCLSPVLNSKSTSFHKDEETLQRIETKLNFIHDNTKHLGPYLSNIEFAILKLKDCSGMSREHLIEIKNEIDKLQREIESQGLSENELASALENKDHALIEQLTKMQDDISRAVIETTKLNASKRDADEIVNALDEQERLKKRDALGIISDISQLLQIALKFYITGNVI